MGAYVSGSADNKYFHFNGSIFDFLIISLQKP
jgi:hypothetical protein